MSLPGWVVFISSAGPLILAVWSNRTTALFHTLVWVTVAWLGWLFSALAQIPASHYCALALTACAGVAAFGARRPGVGAWNFVVVGLLVVLLLPLGEAVVVGTPLWAGTIHAVFLASLIGITVINYVPTRLGFGAALLGVGTAWELARPMNGPSTELPMWCVAFAFWFAWLGVATRPAAANSCDHLWRSFRDRFGLVWSQRVREQFNRATVNGGINTELRWNGLAKTTDEVSLIAAHKILAATVRRFGLVGPVE
jgi:hypothetical protein